MDGPSFLEFLERVSGIKSLIPDLYLSGGGLHSSDPGGILAPHADFHISSRPGLFRQINVLLYLNDDWHEDYGGCLELWRGDDGQKPERIVVPKYGRCVIFKTDDQSIHGFSTPISRQGLWRKSIALYYYTGSDHEQSLLGASRGLTFVANHVNPNIGFGRVRAK